MAHTWPSRRTQMDEPWHTHEWSWHTWLVGSLKLSVSFAKEPYKRDYILQKRPIILRSLLIVATPYECVHALNAYACVCVCQQACCWNGHLRIVCRNIAVQCSVMKCDAVMCARENARCWDGHARIVCCSVAVCCSMLRCVAVSCGMLQYYAVSCWDGHTRIVCGNVCIDTHTYTHTQTTTLLPHTATHCNTLPHTATYCNKSERILQETHLPTSQ